MGQDANNVNAPVVIAWIETSNFGNVKPVGQGVCERRIDFGPGYRVYFGRHGGKLVILLVGGTKNRQQSDIDKAKVYGTDDKRQKKEGR